MKKLSKKDISEIMSKASKWGHKVSPRSKEHYSNIGKKGAEKRWKQFSTDAVAE